MMDGNEMNDLRELVEFLKANEIAEFDVEKGDLKLRLKFAGASGSQTMAGPQPGFDPTLLAQIMAASQPAARAAANAPADAAPSAPTPPAEQGAKHHVVKSPIVGTFYESPSPGSPPFVKIGDVVELGQVLCIVEAMKLMNEIESDAAGEIVERMSTAGQPVEYGQPLFSIKAR